MKDPVAELIANGGARKQAHVFSDEFGEYQSPDNFSPGIIGIVSGELSRFTDFLSSTLLMAAMLPLGTGVRVTKGVDVSGNCNQIVRGLADHHEWVWILGDDHTWSQGTLMRLLAHDVDVVVPHCLKRTPPWAPVAYSHQNDEGWYVAADLPEKGLTEVHAAGSAGMLIKRHVLEAIGDPWFRPAPDAEGLNEDLYFCQRVREEGFKIYCDPSIPFGHIATHWVMPVWGDGGWDVSLVHAQDHALRQPGIHRLGREYERRVAEAEREEAVA